MLRVLLALLLLLSLSAVQAQALYRPVGDAGLGLSAATTLNDGEAADVAGALIVTASPALDLAVSVGRATLGRREATTLGAAATYWVQRTSPSRAGLQAGLSRLEADGRSAVVINVGTVVGRQLDLSRQSLLVPSLSANVIYVASDDFGSGLQTSVSAEAALVLDLGGARAHVGPSVTLNSETSRLGIGIGGGILF